jgi:hypothetical protein
VRDPAVERTLADVTATKDARRIVALLGAGTRETHERHWELVWGLIYRNHAERSADPVVEEATAAYLAAVAAVADRLAALDALKQGMDAAMAVDVLWFYLGRPGWHTLVGERGWDFDRAEAWLVDSARQALLRNP